MRGVAQQKESGREGHVPYSVAFAVIHHLLLLLHWMHLSDAEQSSEFCACRPYRRPVH